LPGHADSVVANFEYPLILVEVDANPEVRVVFQQFLILQRLEAELVRCIGGIGNQFTQKDFLVGIQGMDHEVKQLLHFRLKAERFLGRLFCHEFAVVCVDDLLDWVAGKQFQVEEGAMCCWCSVTTSTCRSQPRWRTALFACRANSCRKLLPQSPAKRSA